MTDENTFPGDVTGEDAPEVTPSEPPQQQTIGDLVKQAVAEAMAASAGHAPDEPGPHIPVPKVEQAPQTAEDANQLGKMFAEYRAEVAALRQELQAHRPRTVQVAGPQETEQDRLDARLAAIAEHSHYCPGCGKLSKYPRECTGTPAGPHAPIEMVSTDELGGDPEKHTRAPSTDPDRPDPVPA